MTLTEAVAVWITYHNMGPAYDALVAEAWGVINKEGERVAKHERPILGSGQYYPSYGP